MEEGLSFLLPHVTKFIAENELYGYKKYLKK